MVQRTQSSRTCKSHFRGPSWSWARSDIHTAIPSFDTTNGIEVESFITFISAQVEINSRDPFSYVSLGCVLTIRAPARFTRISKALTKEHHAKWALGSHSDGSHDPRLRVSPDDTLFLHGPDQDIDHTNFLAIYISTFTISKLDYHSLHRLILKQADNGQYRRIAILDLPYATPLDQVTDIAHFFADVEIQTVTII